ncbi:DNA helicase RecQ [Candidatus Electronema sp. JC]|uniref:DNA helicase RecQ n=1 Tax=Candidatus Electronema sp. JC TaxID=3401570 RepID=UPI003B435C57
MESKQAMPSPETILKSTFGYDTFRPLQREVIGNVLARHDSLAIMPTGGGKSLCYQIPALLFDGLTVVVSPLIALMKDQVEQLRAAGVPALFLNSTLSPEAYSENMASVRRGQAKLLYVAPESLLSQRVLSLLAEVQVDCLTIDEAHCISEWGHDFRPEYRQLADARRRWPEAVCLALTATATPRVRADISSSLSLQGSNEFVASFNRENLFIEVAPKRDGAAQLTRFLERFKEQSGIIYCFSRRQVDELSAYLAQRGHVALPYHAGLDSETRSRNQEAFIRDDVQIMVATIAFGMGINKPNVRFVVHYDLPKSIEGYYQEIGRAGRDGLPAHCLLLYSYGDAAKLKYFINQKEGDERKAAVQQLDAIVRYAEDRRSCRRQPLLAYFGEQFLHENCGTCDNCTAEAPVLEDITIPAQKFLSCVFRVGERFGAAHVADVLLGSKNEKILRFGHEQLSTYGIGKELSQKQWLHLARQLVQMGYLQQDEEHRTLSLTETAREALKSRAKFFGQLPSTSSGTISARSTGSRQMLEHDQALFALLRSKRKELADADGVPPYVIFSDRTLVEMAAYYPQSRESLLGISGVGQVKLEKFGDAFLGVIKPYCQERNLPETARATAPAKAARKVEAGTGMRTTLIGEAYNDGTSIESLMEQHQVKAATILNHLTKYALAGNQLRNVEELQAFVSASPEDRQAALAAFEELGAEYLKPAFDRLDGRVSYDDLKILRLSCLAR